jgi:hypothetical protein
VSLLSKRTKSSPCMANDMPKVHPPETRVAVRTLDLHVERSDADLAAVEHPVYRSRAPYADQARRLRGAAQAPDGGLGGAPVRMTTATYGPGPSRRWRASPSGHATAAFVQQRRRRPRGIPAAAERNGLPCCGTDRSGRPASRSASSIAFRNESFPLRPNKSSGSRPLDRWRRSARWRSIHRA